MGRGVVTATISVVVGWGVGLAVTTGLYVPR